MTSYRLCVAETTTGRVVGDLTLTAPPSWGRGVDVPGTMTQVPFELTQLDSDMLTRIQQPWRWTILYAYGSGILQAGMLLKTTVDDTATPVVGQLDTTTLWDFLSKKRDVGYYSHGLDDALGNVVFGATSTDGLNQNLSWGSVARRLVEIAIGGPGCNGPGNSQPPSVGLSLPIVLPASATGTAAITYAISDTAPVGQRLSEITALDSPPEIEFAPEWTDATQTAFQWRMRVSDTRLGQLGFPWAWDYPDGACQSLQVAIDGTDMTFQSFAKGQDNRGSTGGLLAWAYSSDITPVYPSEGWPWLITADTTHSSITDDTVLRSYADANVQANQQPTVLATMIIRNDGMTKSLIPVSPSIDQLAMGDTGVVGVTNHPLLAPGQYALRILDAAQGPDAYTTALSVQILGLVM